MRTRLLLLCGLLGSVVFLAGVLIEGASRPGYSTWRHAASQLSLGPGWWVNVVLLLVGATTTLAFAAGLRAALPTGPGTRWTPRLLGIVGGALVLLVIFPVNAGWGYPPGEPAQHHLHGLIHATVATVAVYVLAAAPLTLARRFAGDPAWRGWAPYSVGSGVVVAVAYAATTVLATLDETGIWTNAPGGLTQRVALVAGLGWCAALAGRLLVAAEPHLVQAAVRGHA
jgi:Protein of unknown function (DUF998)